MIPVLRIALCVFLLAAVARAQSGIDVTIPVRGATLAATITFPDGQGPHPAVVLLSGSGPSARAALAKFSRPLNALGYATLVFDKRGVGGSTGSWTTASFDDNVGDAAAALDTLRANPRVDARRIGVWGVSQAGWFIPALAARREDLAFAIVLTGGGATPRELEMFMHEASLTRAGVAAEDRQKARALLDAYFDWLGSGVGREAVEDMIAKAKSTSWYAPIAIDRVMPSAENRSNWEWVARYDPLQDIRRMTLPTLVVLGADDRMGSPTVAAERWRAGLAAAGNQRSTVEIIPGMGHAATIGALHAQGGAVMPAYLEAVAKFLGRLDGRTADAIVSSNAGRAFRVVAEDAAQFRQARRPRTDRASTPPGRRWPGRSSAPRRPSA